MFEFGWWAALSQNKFKRIPARPGSSLATRLNNGDTRTGGHNFLIGVSIWRTVKFTAVSICFYMYIDLPRTIFSRLKI